MKNSAIPMVAVIFALYLGACHEHHQGPAERAGEKVDHAGKRAGNAIEDAGDEIEDAFD